MVSNIPLSNAPAGLPSRSRYAASCQATPARSSAEVRAPHSSSRHSSLAGRCHARPLGPGTALGRSEESCSLTSIRRQRSSTSFRPSSAWYWSSWPGSSIPSLSTQEGTSKVAAREMVWPKDRQRSCISRSSSSLCRTAPLAARRLSLLSLQRASHFPMRWPHDRSRHLNAICILWFSLLSISSTCLHSCVMRQCLLISAPLPSCW
mmetsp:Transcript_77237/g.226520  ORF Transcript_77237/g.226520 Transcript_77237/m.226520 type:complete len:206 (+) Transcript_77237:212-829(+)